MNLKKIKNNPHFKIAAVGFLLLCLFQVFLPAAQAAEDNQNTERTYWINLATKAWDFYSPGKSLNTQTGLYAASLDWQYFTEWDLGTQLFAIMDARALGLLPDSGEWGFDNRVAKILGFLKTRELTSNNLPYALYDSKTGQHYKTDETFSIDEGNLYLALYKLSLIKPEFSSDITAVINRNNNTRLIPNPQEWLNYNDFYCYYISYAFKYLNFTGWSQVPDSIMTTIMGRANVTTYGVVLPSAHLCIEPLLLCYFNINPHDSRFTYLLNQIFQAQKARYTATGHYTAFSEGNTGLGDPSYVYEYVVDSDGSTWKIEPQTTPIAFIKVAVGFDAIYATQYTRDAVNYIKGKLPETSGGFQDGVDDNGRMVYSQIDRTNQQILSSARYAVSKITNNPTSTPSSSAGASTTNNANTNAPTTHSTNKPTPTATPVNELSIAILVVVVLAVTLTVAISKIKQSKTLSY